MCLDTIDPSKQAHANAINGAMKSEIDGMVGVARGCVYAHIRHPGFVPLMGGRDDTCEMRASIFDERVE